MNIKKKLLRHSPAEDAVITKAAKSDPDARPLTEKRWDQIKATVFKGRAIPR